MENELDYGEEPILCKTNHKYQYIELKDDGHVYQYCFGCGRELKVR